MYIKYNNIRLKSLVQINIILVIKKNYLFIAMFQLNK